MRKDKILFDDKIRRGKKMNEHNIKCLKILSDIDPDI